MKVLYSELLSFLPKLKAGPREVADAFTFSGLMVDQYVEVRVKGAKDVLLGLEVRQNRPDCLGVIGLAREMSAYFKTPLVLSKPKLGTPKNTLSIAVKAPGLVTRVSAVQIDGLDNSLPTPAWLKEVLAFHDIKSVSLLVDLSNYAMIMTGYPNHLFDSSKVVGQLTWQKNAKDEVFTTLDGTLLEFHARDELVVADRLGPLVLAGSIGGRRAALSSRTTSVIAEVAVYNPKKVRDDSRKHKLTTEASSRLEKQLAAEHSLWALEFLADILVKHDKGQIATKVYDFYPKQKTEYSGFVFWPFELAEKIGGVKVATKEAEGVLRRLGFEVDAQKSGLKVKVPAWRSDVSLPSDITEEVLRMVDYRNITPQKPKLEPLPSLNSPMVELKEGLKKTAAALSLDEVLTLPMTTSEKNSSFGVVPGREEVATQNAINEEFPVLRVNLLGGLLNQQVEYIKFGLYHIKLFEVGRVFWKFGRKYKETEHLAILIQHEEPSLALGELKRIVEALLRFAGLKSIYFESQVKVPPVYDKDSLWSVFLGDVYAGELGLLAPRPFSGNKLVPPTAVAEIDLEAVLSMLPKEKLRGATELQQKMAVLDANVSANSLADLNQRIKELRKKHGKNIWAMEVVDEYHPDQGPYKFTLRITYTGLTETQAKKLHTQLFE